MLNFLDLFAAEIQFFMLFRFSLFTLVFLAIVKIQVGEKYINRSNSLLRAFRRLLRSFLDFRFFSYF